MKKFLAIIAAAAAFAVVACTPEDKPEVDNGGSDANVPVAAFEYAVDGMTVTFTNKSTDAVAYKWDFGDGENSKETNPTHEYASSGEYTVQLTAANSDGVTSKKEAVISLTGSVKAYFSVSTVEGRAGEFGKALKFDASSSENASSIVWDFGDGESSTEFTLTHVFPGFAKYSVKATVTGLDGGTDTYTQEVETVKSTQVIKGGSMEKDDEQYWTVAPLWGYDNGQYEPVEGVYAYAPEFGCTDPNIGHGGCYRYISNPLGWDYNNKGCVYQGIEVREGDQYDIDCLFKWGKESQDNGTLSISVSYGEWAEPDAGGTILLYVNNWWGVHDPDDANPNRYTTWLPEFEGSLADAATAMADYGFEAVSGEMTEEGKLRFTAAQSGTCYISFFVNQVWGFAYGAGRDILLDEISVNAVIE